MLSKETMDSCQCFVQNGINMVFSFGIFPWIPWIVQVHLRGKRTNVVVVKVRVHLLFGMNGQFHNNIQRRRPIHFFNIIFHN